MNVSSSQLRARRRLHMLLLPCLSAVALLTVFAPSAAFAEAASVGGAPARRETGDRAARPADRAAGSNAAQAAEPAIPSGYEAAIDLALREFELRNYPEARARFLEAHKLFPNARTFRALGMVEYELKNYGDAIEALENALRSQVRPLAGALRSQTEALLQRARGYVARINLELNPDVATVVVDGVPVQLGLGGALVLEVGDHSLEFRAPGRLIERRALKITGGEEKTLHVVLPPASEAHPDSGKAEPRPLRKNPWLWTAVGAVAIGAAVGLGVGLSDPGGSSAGPQGGSTGVSLAGPPR